MEEEAAEVWKQSEEVLKEMKKLGCAMVLIPVTIVAIGCCSILGMAGVL